MPLLWKKIIETCGQLYSWQVQGSGPMFGSICKGAMGQENPVRSFKELILILSTILQLISIYYLLGGHRHFTNPLSLRDITTKWELCTCQSCYHNLSLIIKMPRILLPHKGYSKAVTCLGCMFGPCSLRHEEATLQCEHLVLN